METVVPGLPVFVWQGFAREGNVVSRVDPLHGVVRSVGESSVAVDFANGRSRRYRLDQLHLLRLASPQPRDRGNS